MKLFLAAILVPLSLAIPAQQEANEAAADCLRLCPLIYSPICGKNAQGELNLFSSPCYLRVASNCHNLGHQEVSPEECSGLDVNDIQPATAPNYDDDDDDDDDDEE